MIINRLQEEKLAIVLILCFLSLGVFTGVLLGVKPDFLSDEVFEGGYYYLYRAHFHLMGVAAYSFGLFFLTLTLNLKSLFRKVAALSIAVHNSYGLYWFLCFLSIPLLGIENVKEFFPFVVIVFSSMIGLLVALIIIMGNLLFNMFK